MWSVVLLRRRGSTEGLRVRCVGGWRWTRGQRLRLLTVVLADGWGSELLAHLHTCVRVGSGHLVRSTYSENVRFAVALGRLSARTLLDGSGRPRYDRSVAIRIALRFGYDEKALIRAKTDPGKGQDTLF